MNLTVSNRRLLKLADFLQNEVKSEKFDLATFATLEADTLKHGCGTTACAVGWACSIPSFKKAGLKLFNFTSTRDARNHVQMGIQFKDKNRWRAVTLFFGIEENEAYHLFDPAHYGELVEYTNRLKDMTPAQQKRAVIKRIRAFVKDRSRTEG